MLQTTRCDQDATPPADAVPTQISTPAQQSFERTATVACRLPCVETPWNTFVQGCRTRYGVGTVGHAVAAGVPAATFYRRTSSEGWTSPYAGVRVAPWARPSRLTELSALLHAAGDGALACGETAAWLYQLSPEPRKLQVCLPHGRRVPRGAEGLVRRCRWLADSDLAMLRNLPALAPAAMFITLAASDSLTLRGHLIDALHRNQIRLQELTNRLAAVGPVPGRRSLARMVFELADREVESLFHDLVLDELTARGYRPLRTPLHIDTPDGRGVLADIPLPDWRVAVETQGDRFHSSRTQRTADRRRTSQYAGTDWLPLDLDWWEWIGNRAHFFEALDAAILRQFERGMGSAALLPAHLRQRAARIQNHRPGAF